MTPIPSNTKPLTFLFTDIEGSTKLWERYPKAMTAALTTHDLILRKTIESRRGRVFKTLGDGFCAAFTGALDALTAAWDSQQALLAQVWGEVGPLRVRMALHAGPAEARDGDYFGPALNRIARILSVGHGGQTLLSEAVHALVQAGLPDGVSLRDLGAHRLRDLQRPEHLFQLLAPGLPTDFPSLRSLDTLPNNLPRQLTSFVGRERAVVELKRLLATSPLVTIVGIGGAGKTRLALQVAAEVLEEFADGVWLVELAPVAAPHLVPQTVASALGVRAEPGRPIQQTLTEYLGPKQILLILDNCEHLVEACAALAEALLRACPRLRLLCTTREALGITGEISWRIPSLTVPDTHRLPPAEQLTHYEAIRLLIDRASAVVPGFALADEHAAAAAASITQRLDGIPLAIELAASRAKVLSVEQIAARLDDRFRLLTGGSRTALPRQQTLRAAMDWSYDLLAPREQAVLRRLSVFAGVWTLEAAEAILPGDGVEAPDVLDLVTALVDKSLVLVDERGTQACYRMLETVRQYARDKLLDSGEVVAWRTRHRDWFLALAERAEPKLQGPEQKPWLDRLDLEHENLRGALEWSLGSEDATQALQQAWSLWWFWYVRGHHREGLDWMEKALALARTPTLVRAMALSGAGLLAYVLGEYDRAGQLGGEGLALARQLQAPLAIAYGLVGMALVISARGEFDQALAHISESREILQSLDHAWGLGIVHLLLGQAAYVRRDYQEASALFEKSLALFRNVGDEWGIAFAQRGLGLVAQAGDHERAQALHEESLALSRGLGDRQGVAYGLQSLAQVPLRQGDFVRAAQLFRESLEIFRELGDKFGAANALCYLGIAARDQGDFGRAVALISEGLDTFRALGTRVGISFALNALSRTALVQGEASRARALVEESVQILRQTGDKWETAYAQFILGSIALGEHEVDRATQHGEQCLRQFRELGDNWAIALALRLMAEIVDARGATGRAWVLYEESLTLEGNQGDRLGVAESLEGLADLAADQGAMNRAVRLFGAAEAVRLAIGAPLPPVAQPGRERAMAVLRSAMDAAALTAAWSEGRAMALEEALAYARGAHGGEGDREPIQR